MLRASRIIWIQKDASFKHAVRGFYQSGIRFEKFRSVLGDPKVESPFSNSNRVLKDARIDKEFHQSVVDRVKQEIPPTTPEIHKTVAETAKQDIPINNKPLQSVVEPETHGNNEASPDLEKKRMKMARNTYWGLLSVVGGTLAGLAWFCFYYGRTPRDLEGNIIPDEFSGQQFGFFYRILNSFKLWRDYVVEPSREVLLPDPIPYPYHQPKYTLVLEMKNILVSPEWTYKTGYRFKKRPALDYFLDVIGYPNFEVVVYTSESSMTAPSIQQNI
uniref:FCP1 homology domain-containing protein n=1 Tax=Panagrolaimus davidi TaxID=227884 RepID=A0A914QT77_9BILA